MMQAQLSHSFSLSHSLPTPFELLSELPLSHQESEFIFESRRTIERILTGSDPRLLLIVGPCSLHDAESTYEYAEKLRRLAFDLQDQFFICMRAYVEKPRTSKGWKGLLYDPHLDGSYDMTAGLFTSRAILRNLAEMRISAACELLEITTAQYLSDLLSWGCIGARTSASQPHRQLAASLSLPIGFKNTTDGNIVTALNGIVSAASPHIFLGVDQNGMLSRIQASGNPFCHLVLRGGDERPNFDKNSVMEAVQKCAQANVLRRVLIDCSHGNCRKRHEMQIPAFESTIDQVKEGGISILGAMLESHLKEGSQPISSSPEFGLSITDPCLGWEETEELLRRAYEKLEA